MCMIENAGDPVKWLGEEGRARGRETPGPRRYVRLMPLRNRVFLSRLFATLARNYRANESANLREPFRRCLPGISRGRDPLRIERSPLLARGSKQFAGRLSFAEGKRGRIGMVPARKRISLVTEVFRRARFVGRFNAGKKGEKRRRWSRLVSLD